MRIKLSWMAPSQWHRSLNEIRAATSDFLSKYQRSSESNAKYPLLNKTLLKCQNSNTSQTNSKDDRIYWQ